MTTWRWTVTAAVTHTAGRTLTPERSSNGKGTRTTLPFIDEWLAVLDRIDVFTRIGEVVECTPDHEKPQPLLLRRFVVHDRHLSVGDEHDHPDRFGSIRRQ